MTDWPAPTATAPLDAVVEVPGSKSLTNRVLVLAALADGPSTIRGALRSRDADLMIAALRNLGVEITEHDGGTTLIITPPEQLRGDIEIDTGLAGTVMRFLPPVAALADGAVAFDGDEQARERPMAGLLNALRDLGVDVRATTDKVENPSSCAEAGTAGGFSSSCAEAGTAGGFSSSCAEAGTAGGFSSSCAEAGTAGVAGFRLDGPFVHPSTLPFIIAGTGSVEGGEVDIDASASSQFVSALLLAAPKFQHGLTLRHVGATLPSQPHIDMTVEALREYGVEVDDSEPGVWRVSPGPIRAHDVRVEPDLSNALPFLAAALVAGGSVTVPGWPAETTQPGGMVPEILTRLGGRAELNDGALTVTGTGEITPIDLDLSAAGELAPNIAALCALASGTSCLRGIAHLRGHETNRLAALVAEINRLGGEARETEDGLEIVGGNLHGGQFETYHDHRMATSGALVGLRVPGIVVENVETTAKTLPGFENMWAEMLDSRDQIPRFCVSASGCAQNDGDVGGDA